MLYFFLLWNNAFSKETNSSSRALTERCALGPANGNSRKNMAKVLSEEVNLLFFWKFCKYGSWGWLWKCILRSTNKRPLRNNLGKQAAWFLCPPPHPTDKRKKKKGRAHKLNTDSLFCVGFVVRRADRVEFIAGWWEGGGLKKLMSSVTNW